MGSVDPGGITVKLAEQALMTIAASAIDVVLGPQATSLAGMRDLAARESRVLLHVSSRGMAELIRDADVAIGAGGMSALERCCLGLPSIVLCIAENQRANASALEKSGAVFVAESVSEVSLRLADLCNDGTARAGMGKAAMDITDGLGVQRVMDVCGDRLREGA
jgi:spore coat polysaccharide biosynthesis predicted glycosyltransferase SpsG